MDLDAEYERDNGRRIIDELFAAILACDGLAEDLHRGVAFLLANARRANPKTRPQDWTAASAS